MVRRPLRWLLLTLALVAGGVLVAWQTLAPRGFLTVSGQVGEEAISDWAALEYGGQFDAENYIRFSGRGRLSFFGSTRRPAGRCSCHAARVMTGCGIAVELQARPSAFVTGR